jgi:hypothetical protein
MIRKQLNRHYAYRHAPEVPQSPQISKPLVIPDDAYELAALHQRLVHLHRYRDAEAILKILRELAQRPAGDSPQEVVELRA